VRTVDANWALNQALAGMSPVWARGRGSGSPLLYFSRGPLNAEPWHITTLISQGL
jgi:hypothetical protein